MRTPFSYREFYDVPRLILLRREGSLILLESAFDAETDEYSDSYEVFVLPNISPDELAGSWEGLRSKAVTFLGRVPVKDIDFDPTLRREIETSLIDELLRASSCR